jgi:hypothetical protein
MREFVGEETTICNDRIDREERGGGFLKGVDDGHVVGFIRRKKDYVVDVDVEIRAVVRKSPSGCKSILPPTSHSISLKERDGGFETGL